MRALTEKTIVEKIYVVRGKRVMIDSDLANLYGVSTGRLNEQVRRNKERFPEDFMLVLNQNESSFLISQYATSKRQRGGRQKPVKVFTQEGVAMLSSVLRSSRAVAVNIAIMRAFVRLREMLLSHAELSRRLDTLEKKYDERFRVVFEAIRQMMQAPEPPPTRPVGF